MEKYGKNDKTKEAIILGLDEAMSFALDSIPGIGSGINLLLNFRSNLKKKRTIDFFVRFKEILESQSEREFRIEDFTDDVFNDLMDSILINVQLNRSEYKQKLFANLLANQLIDKPKTDELTIKFVQLINDLTIAQLSILRIISLNGTTSVVSLLNQLFDSPQTEDIKPFEVVFYLDDLMSKNMVSETYKEGLEMKVPDHFSQEWRNAAETLDTRNRALSNCQSVFYLTGISQELIKLVTNPA